MTFSKVIDPLTVTTGTMQLVPTSTNIPVAGTVSSNGASATFTPNQPLDLMTQYILELTSGITDMEGQNLYGGSFNSYFTTGRGTPAGPPAITSILGELQARPEHLSLLKAHILEFLKAQLRSTE